MTRLNLPTRLTSDELVGDWKKDQDTIVGSVSDFQGQAVSLLNGRLSTENTVHYSDDYDLDHGVETRIKNPLSVPVAGILALKCVGVELDASNKPTRKLYSLGVPRIDWEKADARDGDQLLVTATFPRTMAGAIGERVGAVLAFASATSLVSGTLKTVVSMPLGVGDWDVSGVVALSGTPSAFTIGLASISADSLTQGALGDAMVNGPTSPNTTADICFAIPDCNVTVSTAQATRTVFLGARANFTGSVTACGRMSARRQTDSYSIAAPRGRTTLFFYGG